MATRVTPADTAHHLERLAEQRRARGRARSHAFRELLPSAARLLKEDYGARRVLVFGSLVTGAVNEQSDLDLAVEGLATQRYFEALAALMALFGAAVDLVRLEEAPESLQHRIAAEGETL